MLQSSGGSCICWALGSVHNDIFTKPQTHTHTECQSRLPLNAGSRAPSALLLIFQVGSFLPKAQTSASLDFQGHEVDSVSCQDSGKAPDPKVVQAGRHLSWQRSHSQQMLPACLQLPAESLVPVPVASGLLRTPFSIEAFCFQRPWQKQVQVALQRSLRDPKLTWTQVTALPEDKLTFKVNGVHIRTEQVKRVWCSGRVLALQAQGLGSIFSTQEAAGNSSV